MNLAELERYYSIFNKLKDDTENFPDRKVTLVLRRFHETPAEKRTNDDGISFLIANAIRKHRGLAYPA